MLSKPVLNQAQREKLMCFGALKSRQCRCLQGKQSGMAFCAKCFFKLPEQMRRALYRKVGVGFEAAYAEAVAFLFPQQATEVIDE